MVPLAWHWPWGKWGCSAVGKKHLPLCLSDTTAVRVLVVIWLQVTWEALGLQQGWDLRRMLIPQPRCTSIQYKNTLDTLKGNFGHCTFCLWMWMQWANELHISDLGTAFFEQHGLPWLARVFYHSACSCPANTGTVQPCLAAGSTTSGCALSQRKRVCSIPTASCGTPLEYSLGPWALYNLSPALIQTSFLLWKCSSELTAN